MNICYKLAPKHKSGVFLSYNVVEKDIINDEFKGRETLLKYEIGKLTEPLIPYSKLFCLDTIQNALNLYQNSFTRINRNYHILVCMCEKIEKYTKESIPNHDFHIFWQFYDSKHEMYGYDVPKGTILTDWVIPIAAISVDDILSNPLWRQTES